MIASIAGSASDQVGYGQSEGPSVDDTTLVNESGLPAKMCHNPSLRPSKKLRALWLQAFGLSFGNE